MLATVDVPGSKKALSPIKRGFYLYRLERSSFDELKGSLQTFAKGLDQSNVDDEGLIEAIDHMKYISETKSILFSGLVNNIFDYKYESNGYFYTYDDDFSTPGVTTTIEGAGYYPQAGINFLAGATLKF